MQANTETFCDAKVIYMTKTLGTPQYKHASSHEHYTILHVTFVHIVTISDNKKRIRIDK